MKMKALPRERLDTKTSTLTLQDARLPYGKRMAYAAVGGGWTLNLRLDSPIGRVWTLNLRLGSPIERIAYKNERPDFAGCPIAMR